MQIGSEFDLHLRQVVFTDGAALRAEAEAVVLYLEEGDGLRLPGEGFVEDENGSFYTGIGLKHAGWQRDHGD